MDWAQFVLGVSSTILSTFVGASAAFHLERKQKKDDLIKMRVEIANRALFTLNRQLGILRGIRNQVINSVPNDSMRWITMPAWLPRNYDHLRFNIGELAFLFDSKDPNVLNDIMLEEDRFFEAINTLNERSHYHRVELQPLLVRLGIQNNAAYIVGELEEKLGHDVVGNMKTLTQALSEHVPEGMEGIRNIYDKLRAILVELLPEEKIIKLQFPAD